MKQLTKSTQSTEPTHSPVQVPAPFNPTLVIRAFREAVLRGDCPMPFSEGVTEAQKLKHAAKLRDRARD